MCTIRPHAARGTPASRLLAIVSTIVAASSVLSATAHGQVIYEVPIPPGATGASVNDISADGTTVVGWGSVSSQQRIAFRWRIGQAIEVLQGLPGATDIAAYAVSADGAYCAGASGTRAIRWGPDGVPQDLGVPAPYATATAINGDGTAVAGQASIAMFNNPVFLWTQSGGVEWLGTHYYSGSAVVDMTPDGTTIVGYDQTVPCCVSRWSWTRATGVVLTTSSYRQPTAVCDLGYPIITTGDSNWPSITKVTEGGFVSYPNSYGCRSYGANANGSVVAAQSWSIGRPVLWTADLQGAQDVATYLADRGVDLTGWTLSTVKNLSADAHVMAGSGVHNGASRSFVAVLPCLDSVKVEFHPTSVANCGSSAGPTTFLVSGTGSGYVAYQWRKNGKPLHNGVGAAGGTGTVDRAQSSLLVISNGPDGRPSPGDSGEYDCVLTVGCVSVTTEPATLQNCTADYNCDHFVNGVDFDSFVDAFVGGTDQGADINHDGFINGVDFDEFMDAFVAGC